MARIGKRVVDAAPPRASRYIVWDDETKGFGFLVLPTGVKSYFFRYRTPEGVERRITIAKHGALTAEQARVKARELQQKVLDGRDPLAEKKAAREAITVGDVLDRYLASARFAEKAPSTRAIDQGRISRHLRPTLGDKFVHRLTTEEVRHAVSAIRNGKTATDERTRAHGRAMVTGGAGTRGRHCGCSKPSWLGRSPKGLRHRIQRVLSRLAPMGSATPF